ACARPFRGTSADPDSVGASSLDLPLIGPRLKNRTMQTSATLGAPLHEVGDICCSESPSSVTPRGRFEDDDRAGGPELLSQDKTSRTRPIEEEDCWRGVAARSENGVDRMERGNWPMLGKPAQALRA